MAITITLYSVTDDPRKLDKTLGNAVATISSVEPLDPCDILYPSFILNWNSARFTANYCKVSVPFDRYYFITSTEMLTGQRVLIKCGIDVLKTYSSSIKNCFGTMVRSQAVGKPTLIPDGKYPIHTNNLTVDVLNFDSTPFERDPAAPYLLTTIGGDST